MKAEQGREGQEGMSWRKSTDWEKTMGEIVKSEPRATQTQAAKLAHILIGSYPKREFHDAKVYSRAIVSVFMEHLFEVGHKAVDNITRRLKFLPTRADVVEELCEIEKERQALRTSAAMEERWRQRRLEAKREAERIAADPITPETLEWARREMKKMAHPWAKPLNRITGRGRDG